MSRLFVFCGIITSIALCMDSCQSPQKTSIPLDSPKKISKITPKQFVNNEQQFEKNNYLSIDKIYSGHTYINSNGNSAFYRILEIPEEENIALYVENISVGEEGGNYQLIKRVRLTDDNSVLPKFGLSTVDSLKFIDSVKIEGYFNDKKRVINLVEIK
jgi:hypothetical protein